MKNTNDFSDSFYPKVYKHGLNTKFVFLLLCLPFLFMLHESTTYILWEQFPNLTALSLLKNLWIIIVSACFIYISVTRFIGYKITLLTNGIKIETLFGVEYIMCNCIYSYSYYFNTVGNGVRLRLIDKPNTESIKNVFLILNPTKLSAIGSKTFLVQ